MGNIVKIGDLIREHRELLYKLDKAGIKNINTALDYVLIEETHKAYSWIKDKGERTEVTASRCRVSVRTVATALSILDQDVNSKKGS